mmetsp:Transcript_49571/g.128621  ORF Transcript_49571/g.128621 Transcript_49571/m.128621 type:complete len:273 (+) Transcript_49571:93-911(+)
MAQSHLSTACFVAPRLQEFPSVKMEEPVTDNATVKAKAKAKAKGKPKAKSTARQSRVARQPAVVAIKKRSVMLSKKPPVVKQKEASSPEPADRPDGVKPELAAQESKQLVLNMDRGGAMRLDDPKKVLRKHLKGPAIGGDFSKARNSKRTRCSLRDFRSHAYMYRALWQGRFKRTTGGLTKDDLTVSITGKIVPKRRSAHCRKIGTENGWVDHWRHWLRATRDARAALGVDGFVKVKKNGTDDEMALFSCTVANYTSSSKKRRPLVAEKGEA